MPISLIHNERLKLFATYLNGLGIATFAVGGLTRIFSLLFGTISTENGSIVWLLAVACLLASVGLHHMASSILRCLQP